MTVAKQVGSVLILKDRDADGTVSYTVANINGAPIYGLHRWKKLANAEKRAKAINRRIASNTGR